MRKNKIRAHCPRCHHQQLFIRAQVNHPLHLALSVVTLGLWLISWVAVCIGNYVRPWRCEHCGWQKPEFGDDHSLIRPAKRLAASRFRPASRPPPIIGARSTHLQP